MTVDPWRRLIRLWGRRVPKKAAMAHDIAGTSAQWAEALALMDMSRRRRLSLREENRVLDTIVTVQDAEREAAARALRARIERERRR